MEAIRARRGHAPRGAVRLIAAALGLALAAPVAAQELSSSNPQALQHYQRGKDLLVNQGDWSGAATEFTAAVAFDPNFAEAHSLLGVCQGRLRQFTAAKASFERALALGPEAVEPRVNLAQALTELGLRDQAESQAKAVLKRDEAVPEAHAVLGQVYLHDSATHAKAVQHYRRAVDLRPSVAAWHQGLAAALHLTGRFNDCVEELLLAIRLDPKQALYKRELGVAYFQLERYAEAAESLLEAAKDKDTRGLELYVYLMRSAYHLGLYGEALLWAVRAGEEAPANARVLLFAGMLQRHLCDYRKAEGLVAQALRMDPALPGAHYELGMIRFDTGDFRGAVQDLRRQVEGDPADQRGWYQLGLAYRALGMTEEARQALAEFKKRKDAEQEDKERSGVEAGPPDEPPTTRAASRPIEP